MPRFPRLLVSCALLAALSFATPLPTRTAAEDPQPKKVANPAKTKFAWTYEQARRELELSPRDAYLQYITLQLAPAGKESVDTIEFLERTLGLDSRRERLNRRERVDLFNIFSGALAVQESLQLDAMSGISENREQLNQHRQEKPAKSADQKPVKSGHLVSALVGPTIKSHPWEQMLAGRKPSVSELSKCVPDDYFLIEFKSLNKLLEASEISDLWATHLFDQAYHEAVTYDTGNRLRRQLAVETNPLLRPFYDLVVSEVAVTGSDLFLRDGSDVSLLFRFTQPLIFQSRMDGFLANARKQNPDARHLTGKYRGVDYVHVGTPDRKLMVFSAYPQSGLHVRSNSLKALERIIDAVQGKDSKGKTVSRLGETAEFQYVRTLMPRGAKEEDGFIYLSDPFIRRLVGPQLKLTASRRMSCYNHLKMIGHGATLYQTQFGRAPKSLAEIEAAGCSPGLFGEDFLKCQEKGKYSLAPDGLSGICSHHGSPHYLTPCNEIPVEEVTDDEATAYKGFLEGYNQYWRTFFDPIAVRLQVTPQRYRLETIVLPLIDKSIYTNLAATLGGHPEPLDDLPVPPSNIFSLALKFDKASLLKKIEKDQLNVPLSDSQRAEKLDPALVLEFLEKGIGNQVGFHVCDSVPSFDLNVPSLLGELTGGFGGSRNSFHMETLGIAFLISSLNSPVYVSVPTQDAAVVDRFLETIAGKLAPLGRKQQQRRGWFETEQDFYNLSLPGIPRCYGAAMKLGPVKWRFLWARIGNGLYIASQKETLEQIAVAEKQRATQATQEKQVQAGPRAHAMVRVRPQHWQKVLPAYRLGWAENNREACLNNLSCLSSAARAVQAVGNVPLHSVVSETADRLRGGHGFCPDGGHYHLTADGTRIACSHHGSLVEPKQGSAPDLHAPAAELLQRFQDLTLVLTFLEDGLHAIVSVDRLPAEATPKPTKQMNSTRPQD